jgi:F0F1-type ATP synthase membrane subunit c/vacuolar-type H+-ATPase subunit K
MESDERPAIWRRVLFPWSGLSRELRRTWLKATALYLGLVYATQWILWFLEDGPALARAVVGLVPAIGIAYMIRAMILSHRAQDELQRRIDAEATIVMAMIVGAGTFTYGLVVAALGATTQPTVWALFLGPAMILVWGLAKVAITLRYR